MKPTRLATLFSAAVSLAILAYGVCLLVVRAGDQLPISTFSLVGTLFVISVVLVILALPIFRYRAAIKSAIASNADSKARPIKRVDPFYALRVALLSKAISSAGSVFVGWHAGVLVAVLSSPQISATNVWSCSFGVAASLSMVIAGLVVERSCKVPPDANATTETDASPA